MSGSSSKCCSNLSALEPPTCGVRGAHFLMEICQGIPCAKACFLQCMPWHGVLLNMSQWLKKRERKCPELADVSGSVPVLAGVCSQRPSCWILGSLLAEVPVHRAVLDKGHRGRKVRNWAGWEVWDCGLFLEYIIFFFSAGFSILNDDRKGYRMSQNHGISYVGKDLWGEVQPMT